MKYVWAVFDTISDKWIYDAAVSMSSVRLHEPGAELVVYHDTDGTRRMLEELLGGFADATFIPDGGWCADFSGKVGASETYGPSVFCIFRAMQEQGSFAFLDTDVYCWGPPSLECRTAVGAYVRGGVYSRCVTLFRHGFPLPLTLPHYRKGQCFTDELLFRHVLREHLSPLTIRGLSHFGQGFSMEKGTSADPAGFRGIITAIRGGKPPPYAEVRRYFLGGKDDSVLR